MEITAKIMELMEKDEETMVEEVKEGGVKTVVVEKGVEVEIMNRMLTGKLAETVKMPIMENLMLLIMEINSHLLNQMQDHRMHLVLDVDQFHITTQHVLKHLAVGQMVSRICQSAIYQ